ncbi:hypothetical protein ACFL6G_00730 [candidate division KSB1 bacterium]
MHLTEQFFIEKCKALIEEKLNLTDSSEWRQRDFEYLSELIFEETSVLLSISTLKRIWNSGYEGTPHTGTLNALSVFLGFKNWHDFKKALTEDLNNVKTNHVKIRFLGRIQEFIAELRRKDIPVYRNKVVLTVILFLITIPLLSYTLINKIYSPFDHNDIKFSSRKVITSGVPNTVIFDYDVSSVDSDSIIIQQSWDTRRRAVISADNHQCTSVYYYPGYHHAKLMIDGKIVKQHDIHITTDGWLANARKNQGDLIPVYLPKEDIITNGRLFISPYTLRANNVNLSDNNYWISFYNVQDFGDIYGDNFTFETEVKNSISDGGLTGQYMTLTIMCQNGRIVVPLTIPGLVGQVGVKFLEAVVPGTENDLSAFGCDMSNWNNLRIEVKDKDVKIGLNGSKIFGLTFANPAGKIIGLHYMFCGCGAVNYVKLIDGDNNVVLEDDFMLSKIIESGHASLIKQQTP